MQFFLLEISICGFFYWCKTIEIYSQSDAIIPSVLASER